MKKVTKEMLEKLPHRSQVMFGLFCAKQVEDTWKDIPKAVKAIETVERWLIGKATKEECKEAADAAYHAANASYAAYAAYAAAWTAEAAAKADYATSAADYTASATAEASLDRTKTAKKQLEYYDDLLAMVDGRVDKILVG